MYVKCFVRLLCCIDQSLASHWSCTPRHFSVKRNLLWFCSHFVFMELLQRLNPTPRFSLGRCLATVLCILALMTEASRSTLCSAYRVSSTDLRNLNTCYRFQCVRSCKMYQAFPYTFTVSTTQATQLYKTVYAYVYFIFVLFIGFVSHNVLKHRKSWAPMIFKGENVGELGT